MKVLTLPGAHAHVVEGWFGSEEDFQGQRDRGLVECPMCGMVVPNLAQHIREKHDYTDGT